MTIHAWIAATSCECQGPKDSTLTLALLVAEVKAEIEVSNFALQATPDGEGERGRVRRARQQAGFSRRSVSQTCISILKALFIFPIGQSARNSLLFPPSVHVSFAHDDSRLGCRYVV